MGIKLEKNIADWIGPHASAIKILLLIISKDIV
jgi:hypothetical protein